MVDDGYLAVLGLSRRTEVLEMLSTPKSKGSMDHIFVFSHYFFLPQSSLVVHRHCASPWVIGRWYVPIAIEH